MAEEGVREENILRILVSTDNHLGFMERDQNRCNDSFAAFEEVLLTAKKRQADLILLAGDLFHENKPSRRTLVQTIGLIRKHCLGSSPIQFQVLSEQRGHFRTGHVNYEDPHFSVDLPIFAIHGNHDDPNREGGAEPLSALDILAESNLVNYFGKSDQVEEITVNPVLLQKGETCLALYGLGNVRDERLNRIWTSEKVKFLRPNLPDGLEKFFNVFALHQNKNAGRGTKNCVHESMIPEWMDFVVWGNEHECEPNLIESITGTFQIIQPGSSIATSLVESEARPKHMMLLSVHKNEYKTEWIPYTQVRPFRIGEINLRRDAPFLNPDDPKIEEQMAQVLAERVRALIGEAKQDVPMVVNGGRDQEYRVLNPDKVLVRLRVEHAGFPSLNNQRFGGQFLKEAANPGDTLLFSRKQGQAARAKPRARTTAVEEVLENEAPEIDRIRIEDLVKKSLESSEKKLVVLPEMEMTLALEDYIHRHNTSAILDAVEEVIDKVTKELRNANEVRSQAVIKEVLSERADRLARRVAPAGGKQDEDAVAVGNAPAARRAAGAAVDGDDGDDVEHSPPEAKPTKRKAPAKRKATKAAAHDSEDELRLSSSDESTHPAPKRGRAAAKAPAATAKSTRGRKKATPATRTADRKKHDDSELDDDVEEEEHAPAVATTARRGRPQRRAAATPAKYSMLSDSEESDNSDVSEHSGVDEESEAEVSEPSADSDSGDYKHDDEAEFDDAPRPKKRAPAAAKAKATRAKSSSAGAKKRATKAAAVEEVDLTAASSDVGVSQSQASKRQLPWGRR